MSTFAALPVNVSMIPIEKKAETISRIGIGHTMSIFSNHLSSAKFVMVFSLLLIFTALTLSTQSIFAQGVPVGTDAGSGYCSLHGNYKGSSCPKCSSGASGSSAGSPGVTRDPGQIALQNAIPRYDSLVRSLADSSLLDKQSWLELPHGTEAEFFRAANQMHKELVNQADAIRFGVGKLREELAYLNEVIETYPGLTANLRTNNLTMRLESNRLAVALEAAKQQLELTQKAAKQLETRAYRYEEDVKRDKETVLSWFAVLLPPGMVKTVSPIPYESIREPLVGSVPVRQRTREPVEWPKPIEPIPFRTSKYGIRLQIDPKPLTGTAEDAVAQLEADSKALHAVRPAHGWGLINEVRGKRQSAAQFGEAQRNAIDEREELEGKITTFGGQLKATTWALLLARDTLQSAQETFLYRAADAWIWKNAKSEAIRQVKNEVRRLVAAKTTGVRYHDMTDVEMRAFYSAGKRNIFGLGDKPFSGGKYLASGDKVYQVLNRFQTLRTQTLAYVQEAVRVATLGSPREMIEFVGRMDEGIDEASKELVKANLGAMKIPEPWQSISAKYFLKRPE